MLVAKLSARRYDHVQFMCHMFEPDLAYFAQLHKLYQIQLITYVWWGRGGRAEASAEY
jgi:hypothetical protein